MTLSRTSQNCVVQSVSLGVALFPILEKPKPFARGRTQANPRIVGVFHNSPHFKQVECPKWILGSPLTYRIKYESLIDEVDRHLLLLGWFAKLKQFCCQWVR